MNIGALWIKESKKDGKKFMSGEINLIFTKISIMVFKNEEKEGSQPDYRIVLAEPRKDKEAPATEDLSADDVPF